MNDDPLPRIARVRLIAEGLEELRWKRESPEDYEEFEEKARELIMAICEEDWNLVGDAVDLIKADALPRDDKARMKTDAKWLAYHLSKEDGLNLTKKEIINVILDVFPEFEQAIPTSENGLTKFWKDVEGQEKITQARGNRPQSERKNLEKYIARAAEMKKAGFPDYLGHRSNPCWD